MSTSNSSLFSVIARRRMVIALFAVAALAVASVPVGWHALTRFDLYQAERALDNVDLEGAIEWLQAAGRRQPKRADVQYRLAMAYRRHAQYGLAQDHLDRARALGWPMRELERQRMMILFQMGDFAQSESYLKKLLEQGGSDDVAEDVFEAMTIGYMAEHRLKDATLCLNYWIEWRPDSLRAHLLRAYHNSAMLNVSATQAELREVLRIAPGRLAERLALAESLLDQSLVDEALAQCEICRRQEPENPAVLLDLGLCHYRLGRIEEAEFELKSAVRENLDDDLLARGFTALGQIASSARDLDAAARFYEEAVERAPQDPANFYALGIAMRGLGKYELSAKYLERSKTLRTHAVRLGEIKKDLANDPTDIALRVEGATILREQGKKAQAVHWMNSVLHYNPRLRVAHEFLADLLDEYGAREQAQGHREAARNGTELPGADALVGPDTPGEH